MTEFFHGNSNSTYPWRECNNFKENGDCQFGEFCNFSHGEEDFREQPRKRENSDSTNKPEDKEKLKKKPEEKIMKKPEEKLKKKPEEKLKKKPEEKNMKKPKDNEAQPNLKLQEPYQWKECNNFKQTSECKHGEYCKFSHGKEDFRERPREKVREKIKSEIKSFHKEVENKPEKISTDIQENIDQTLQLHKALESLLFTIYPNKLPSSLGNQLETFKTTAKEAVDSNKRRQAGNSFRQFGEGILIHLCDRHNLTFPSEYKSLSKKVVFLSNKGIISPKLCDDMKKMFKQTNAASHFQDKSLTVKDLYDMVYLAKNISDGVQESLK